MEQDWIRFFVFLFFTMVRTQLETVPLNTCLSTQFSVIRYRYNAVWQISRTYSFCTAATLNFTPEQQLPFPPPHSPWNPPFYSLLLGVPLSIAHNSGSIQHLSFHYWCVSPSIRSSRFIVLLRIAGFPSFFKAE